MRKSLLFSSLILLAACSSGGDSSGGGSDDLEVPATSCGTIAQGEYKNPIRESDGDVLFLSSVSSPNTMILSDDFGQEIPVRLLGLTGGYAQKADAAKRFIQDFSGSNVLYVPTGCKDDSGAFVGAVFNSEGENLAEALVRGGLAEPRTEDICNGSRIGQCFASIANSDPVTAGELDTFLWKPVSDSDGKLAIHTGPFGTTVIVSGETGRNQGPGNGFGSLARFNRPGCGYPGATVQVLNSEGLPYTLGGKTTIAIPSPCSRYCGENGKLFACTKS